MFLFYSSLEDRLKFDVAIIGAGIVGTAIAREIKIKSKDVKTILIEKECSFGKHQTGHNSGVIHTGAYPFQINSFRILWSRYTQR